MSQALSLPSTPNVKAQTPAPVFVPPSPGNWRHPKLDEIVRRQNVATFGDQNLKTVVWNGAALLAAFAFGQSFTTKLGSAFQVAFYPDLVLWLVRLGLFINIVLALAPLWRRRDDFSDIPLTPSQRKLLGLDPTYTPPVAPDTSYITPPRYRRSSGSLNATPNSRGSSYSSSPGSGTASPSTRNVRRASPFSPSPSPLIQRAFGESPLHSSRRHSYGSAVKPIAAREVDKFRAPGTPSPIGNKNASVGLNYKWLYEKSRGMPRSESNL